MTKKLDAWEKRARRHEKIKLQIANMITDRKLLKKTSAPKLMIDQANEVIKRLRKKLVKSRAIK